MHLNNFLTVVFVVVSAPMVTTASAATETPNAVKYWQSSASSAQEAYLEEELPPGIQVVATPLDSPVYADAEGHTLYTWPLRALRNGSTGDRKDGASNCTDEVLRTEVGFMSPYPAGLVLPYSDQGVSCTQVWPPVLAPEDAEQVGKWTLVKREDDSNQWAYGGFPLYTSNLDEKPGDVLGGTKINCDRDSQGEVHYADMSVSIVRPKCLENLDKGLLPQKWMGKKIASIRNEAGFDIDFKWQLPQLKYWIKKYGSN